MVENQCKKRKNKEDYDWLYCKQGVGRYHNPANGMGFNKGFFTPTENRAILYCTGIL